MLFSLGNLSMMQGGHTRAAARFCEALALTRRRGDEIRLARDTSGLAAALLNLDERPRARDLMEESIAVARRFAEDDRWSLAMSLTLMAHVDLADDDAHALDLLAEAAGFFHAIRQQIGMLIPPIHAAGYTRTMDAVSASLPPHT